MTTPSSLPFPFRAAALVACCCVLLLVVRPAAGDVRVKVCCATGEKTPGWDFNLCDERYSGTFLDVELVDTNGDGLYDNYDEAYDDDYGNAVSDCENAGGYVDEGRLCVPMSLVEGDPHVTGFDGSHYLLWGKPNATYNLISERRHQVNARLYHPPSLPAGSALFIEAVGIMIRNVRITVHIEQPAAGSTAAPSMVLAVHSADGSTKDTMAWPGKFHRGGTVDARTFYTFKSETHIQIISFDISLSIVLRTDHLDVSVEEVATSWVNVHGILGQTYHAAFHSQHNLDVVDKGTAAGELPMPAGSNEKAQGRTKKQLALDGREDDYITSGLLSTDDMYSRFVGGFTVPMALTRKLRIADSGISEGARVLSSGTGVSAVARQAVPAGRQRSLQCNECIVNVCK